MTGEAFEYAIKKDVRNNPIVREIDRERHREMWRSAGTGVFLVGVLVFYVWQQTNALRVDVLFHRTQENLVKQENENQQLRVQVETMRSSAVVDAKARHRLGMVAPGPNDTSVIERVISSPPPASSVLARR